MLYLETPVINNSTVAVSVVMSNTPVDQYEPIVGMQFDLTYDPTQLQFIGGANVANTSQLEFRASASSAGTIRVLYFPVSADNSGSLAEGRVATAIFSRVGAGQFNSLSVNKAVMGDQTANNIISFANSAQTIDWNQASNGLIDSDGDGISDNVDADIDGDG